MSRKKRFKELIKRIYAKYQMGGSLHIVLDDYNIGNLGILRQKRLAYG